MNLYQKMSSGKSHMYGGVKFRLEPYKENINPLNAHCNLHYDTNFLVHPNSSIVIEENRRYVAKTLVKKNKWKYSHDTGKYALGVEFTARFGRVVIKGKSIHNVIRQSYKYSIALAKLDSSFRATGHFYYYHDTQQAMFNRHKLVYSWFNKPWRTE